MMKVNPFAVAQHAARLRSAAASDRKTAIAALQRAYPGASPDVISEAYTLSVSVHNDTLAFGRRLDEDAGSGSFRDDSRGAPLAGSSVWSIMVEAAAEGAFASAGGRLMSSSAGAELSASNLTSQASCTTCTKCVVAVQKATLLVLTYEFASSVSRWEDEHALPHGALTHYISMMMRCLGSKLKPAVEW
jgi:hypothetical protein